jgi:hypothetical protein
MTAIVKESKRVAGAAIIVEDELKLVAIIVDK